MPGRNSAGTGRCSGTPLRTPASRPEAERTRRAKAGTQGARDEERAFLAVQRAVRQSARLVQVTKEGTASNTAWPSSVVRSALADDDDHRPLAERAASGDLRLKERRQRLELVRRQAERRRAHDAHWQRMRRAA